jgi:hypothetical protein
MGRAPRQESSGVVASHWLKHTANAVGGVDRARDGQMAAEVGDLIGRAVGAGLDGLGAEWPRAGQEALPGVPKVLGSVRQKRQTTVAPIKG